ncbi:hypothetical protein [Methanospirillum lacunae]|uniref:hypothetical protein n=1 Tax=Methanospirillum lacunae TaxID=668570 RepID=UPI0011B29019|nr:hypothetical protein [Methanospirillum lacunae]
MNREISPSNRIAWLLIQEGSNHGFSSGCLSISILLNWNWSGMTERIFKIGNLTCQVPGLGGGVDEVVC